MVKYDKGTLTFDLHLHDALLNNLDQGQAGELIESMSCADAVIDHVMDQIFDGFTISGYHGSMTCGGSVYKPTGGLDAARERIANGASDLAEKEIGNLRTKLAQQQNEINDLHRRLNMALESARIYD